MLVRKPIIWTSKIRHVKIINFLEFIKLKTWPYGFSRQDWFSTLPGFGSEGLLGAKNVRPCLLLFHMEMEALIWAIEYMKNLKQYWVMFTRDCSQLVKIVSESDEWPPFESYLKTIKLLRKSFTNSDMVHVPRTENIKADRLARSVRKQPSFVIHMDAELPPSFTESTWVCECLP